MGKIESKNNKYLVCYRAVCAQGDLPDSMFKTEEEALEVVFKHQEQHTDHQVKVVVVQSN